MKIFSLYVKISDKRNESITTYSLIESLYYLWKYRKYQLQFKFTKEASNDR